MDPALELAQLFPHFESRSDGYYVPCPVPSHEDKNPSLCISIGENGKPLWICRAGCDKAAVTEAMKPYRRQTGGSGNGSTPPTEPTTPPRAKIVAEYNYHDENGKLLYQVVRFDPKKFLQRKPDSTTKDGWIWKVGNVHRVLFQLPQIIKQNAVVVVEGEKDALALTELGIIATCNAGGAGKWKRIYSESLRGKRVAIIADRDAPGRKHAQDVATQLHGIAASVRVLEPAYPHKDVTDWIQTGATRDIISTALKATPEWEPGPQAGPSAIIHGDGDQPTLHDPADWPHGLMHGDKGPRAISGNALYALRAHPSLKGLVVRDTFTSRITVSRETPWGTPAGQQWSDKDDNLFAEFMQHIDVRIGNDTANAAATTISHEQTTDSLQDYLRSLKWDGTPRAGSVGEMLGAPSDLSAELVLRWLVSAVARAMRPGCQVDHVLVLEGSQGIRKSTALRTLFDPLDRGWFRDDLPPLNSKDAQQFLEGTWCVEIAELDAVNSRRAELEHVKAFLSRRVDSYRPPYARRVQDFPRRVVFAGSTNDAHYLKDTTGNRRWWPIACESAINIAALAEQVGQIWAEAVQLFDSKYEWWLDSTTPANEDLAKVQESRRTIDPWEAEVLTFLQPRTYCTMDELFTHLKINIDKRTQVDSNRVQRILSAFGWTRKQLVDRGVKWWAYVSDPDATWKTITGDQPN